MPVLRPSLLAAVSALAVLFLATLDPAACLGAEGETAGHAVKLHEVLPLWTVAPFVLMLLCIAVLPLSTPHWWEHNSSKAIVAAALGLPIVAYLAAVGGEEGVHKLLHVGSEYVSFIVLLGSLFVISGNVYVKGSLSGTPLVNTGVLGLGAVIASFVGTTGASVLLIRPLLRANASRIRQAHIVVFFIFIVSNCGGLLTPLGDPPLFLGFLKGVPFAWTLQLWREWLVVNGMLLVIFNVWDQATLNKEERERPGSQLEQVMKHEKLRILGLHNFFFLAGVVAVIYSSGQGLGNGGEPWPFAVSECLMLALAGLSYATTKAANRHGNKFSFGPIVEVAVLFAGIFVTMIPALVIVNANSKELGIDQPWEFFWAAGLLSSFLDNAPTYLTFAATACGLVGIGNEGQYLAAFLAQNDGQRAAEILAAISCGAVFMGAVTYIGNGPNFMVKAIAEENGVKMPGFFGYMLYSCGILIPIFVAVTFLFFL